MTAVGLDRFHSGQVAGQPSAHVRALTELRAGRKHSRWIWFVLRQLASLGRSAAAARLEVVIGVIDAQLRQPGQSPERLMGSGLVTTRTVSSLTLFEAAGLERAGFLLDQIVRHCAKH